MNLYSLNEPNKLVEGVTKKKETWKTTWGLVTDFLEGKKNKTWLKGVSRVFYGCTY